MLKIRNERLCSGALDDLESGLDEYRRSQMHPTRALELFRSDILSHAEHLRSVLDDVGLKQTLRNHTRWLQEFNHRYDPNHVNN